MNETFFTHDEFVKGFLETLEGLGHPAVDRPDYCCEPMACNDGVINIPLGLIACMDLDAGTYAYSIGKFAAKNANGMTKSMPFSDLQRASVGRDIEARVEMVTGHCNLQLRIQYEYNLYPPEGL